MGIKRDTDWFISKSKSIHGEKFDYSNAVYINAKTPIEIKCIKHNNIFHQVSNNHFKNPFACKDCLVERKRAAFGDSKDGFIKKSIKVFGKNYDYSEVNYINQRTKVKIRCIKHDLKFEQTPSVFLKGIGCGKCSKENIDSKRSDETLFKIRNYVKKIEGKCLSKEYINNQTNLEFECKYGHHFHRTWGQVKTKKRWCPECSKKEKKNKKIDIFIAKAKKIHNDNYDYSRTEYVENNKVRICCKVHGEFEQSISVHLRGGGCKLCGIELMKTKQRGIKSTNPSIKKTSKKYNPTLEFIKKAKLVHGDRYDYSEVEYINSNTKVKIICKEHGLFEASPSNHVRNRNCPTCAHIEKGNKRRFTKEDFIQKAIEVHGELYNYNEVEYVSSQTHILITCPKHGDFITSPNNHLRGKKCRECHFENLSSIFSDDTDSFIKKAIETHGKTYDYSLVDYVNAKEKVKIICKEHGVFEQNSVSHIKGVGCPSCASYGFDRLKPSTFYIRKLYMDNGDIALKYGITNQKHEDRAYQQSLGLMGELETVFTAPCLGVIALEIEGKCKTLFGRKGFLSEEQMPDGHTESVKYSEDNLSKIKSIVDEVLNVKDENARI